MSSAIEPAEEETPTIQSPVSPRKHILKLKSKYFALKQMINDRKNKNQTNDDNMLLTVTCLSATDDESDSCSDLEDNEWLCIHINDESKNAMNPKKVNDEKRIEEQTSELENNRINENVIKNSNTLLSLISANIKKPFIRPLKKPLKMNSIESNDEMSKINDQTSNNGLFQATSAKLKSIFNKNSNSNSNSSQTSIDIKNEMKDKIEEDVQSEVHEHMSVEELNLKAEEIVLNEEIEENASSGIISVDVSVRSDDIVSSDSQSTSIQWQWFDDGGEWHNYDIQTMFAIEYCYLRNIDKYQYEMFGSLYSVDIQQMKHFNKLSEWWKVRRVICEGKMEKVVDEKSIIVNSISMVESNTVSIDIELKK